MVRLLWLLVILSCSLAQASLPRDGLLTATRSGWLTVAGSFGGQLSSLYVNTNRAELYSDATFATAQGLSLANGYNQFVTAGTNAAGALVLSTVTTNWLPVTVSFSYDLNGNLVSDGQKSYEYDRANQLTSVTLPGEWRTEYAYDGLGRRRINREYTWRGGWVLASEVRYVYDRMLVLQERRADNTVLATYTRGLDLSGSMQGAGGIGGLLARTDSAGSTYYHSDGGGNITSLTDSSGAVVGRYLYDPFGRLLGRWGPMAEVNRYQFSSKETDRLTGLSYYGYRFYDPTLQRWLNQDPLGEGGGINLYGFVGNSPLNAVDPLGLQIGAGYGTMPLPHFPENNEPPPTWVTLMPIAGSGAQASYDFKQGNWGWGTFNLALAASDIVPVRSATTGLAKGGWKSGSHTWNATRKWLNKCWREFKGQEMHHWAIPREGWGANIPEWLKNQPWNLTGMPNEVLHDALHGFGQAPFSFGERLWFGTPDWFKASAFSLGGREANWMFNPGSFTAPSDSGAVFLGPVPSNP